jgi:uncharacterized membrane protein YfcA
VVGALAPLLPPDIAPGTALLLVGLSFFTSALSATFGLGGGMAMLGALAGTVSPQVVIAVHAVVQVFSNLGRTVLQRAHVAWPVVLRFSGGGLVGIGLGALMFRALPTNLLLAVIGVFILALVWLPKPAIPGLARFGAALGGLATGALTMFVGATGPFVQAVLLPLVPERKALVATHAMCMTLQHGLKIVAFGLIGVPLGAWLPLLAAMVVAGFAGTWFGSALLERLSERVFRILIKTLLTLVALDLLRRAAGF